MNNQSARYKWRSPEDVSRRTRVPELDFRVAEDHLSRFQKIVGFAVVPSLILWSIVWLAVSGHYLSAIAVGGTSVASGIVGWFLSIAMR
jgi:hypothetical protein